MRGHKVWSHGKCFFVNLQFWSILCIVYLYHISTIYSFDQYSAFYIHLYHILTLYKFGQHSAYMHVIFCQYTVFIATLHIFWSYAFSMQSTYRIYVINGQACQHSVINDLSIIFVIFCQCTVIVNALHNLKFLIIKNTVI